MTSATARVLSSRIRSILQSKSPVHQNVRNFSAVNGEWRKQQLDKLEEKFRGRGPQGMYATPTQIDTEDDLQSTWKSMESRVTNRQPRTREQTRGRTGRVNIKKTDEEMWLMSGLYDEDDKDKKDPDA